MSFQFQIHNDLKFQRNTELLEKARAYIPQMKKKTVDDFQLVHLIQEESRLESVGIEPTEEKLEQLSLEKGNQVILDFKDHHEGNFQ